VCARASLLKLRAQEVRDHDVGYGPVVGISPRQKYANGAISLRGDAHELLGFSREYSADAVLLHQLRSELDRGGGRDLDDALGLWVRQSLTVPMVEPF